MTVIQLPAIGEDMSPDGLVAYHAIESAVRDDTDFHEQRRQVVVALGTAEECMTIADLRDAIPADDYLIPMLLGELQAQGFVGKHSHPNVREMHYHLTELGERMLRAN